VFYECEFFKKKKKREPCNFLNSSLISSIPWTSRFSSGTESILSKGGRDNTGEEDEEDEEDEDEEEEEDEEETGGEEGGFDWFMAIVQATAPATPATAPAPKSKALLFMSHIFTKLF